MTRARSPVRPARPRSSTRRSRCPTCDATLPSRRRRARPGQVVTAAIDVERRDAIRRNHTATHLTTTLRQVLGDHVKQAGSLVAPDRLRFDFSHYEPVTPEQIEEIERLTNANTLANTDVRVRDDEDRRRGARRHRLLRRQVRRRRRAGAGPSIELCGGTHVRATGDIGTVKVVSEGSIGSNLRRIEAITGEGSVALLQRDERALADVGRLVGAPADQAVEGVQRKLDELRALADEVKVLRAKLATGQPPSSPPWQPARRRGGAWTAWRRTSCVSWRSPSATSQASTSSSSLVRRPPAASASPGGEAQLGIEAAGLIRDAAKAVGGGGGKGDVATAGGKDTSGIGDALTIAKDAVVSAAST